MFSDLLLCGHLTSPEAVPPTLPLVYPMDFLRFNEKGFLYCFTDVWHPVFPADEDQSTASAGSRLPKLELSSQGQEWGWGMGYDHQKVTWSPGLAMHVFNSRILKASPST